MNHRRPWYLRVYTLLAVPILVACILVQQVFFGDLLRPKPTGETLLASFETERSGFAQLAAMMREDQSLGGIGRSWTSPSPASATGLDRARLREYRRLMRQAGVESIQRSPELANDVPLTFQVYGKGTLGAQYGYLYTQGEVYDRLVENLADLDYFTGVRRLLYRIDDNWYIYYRKAG